MNHKKMRVVFRTDSSVSIGSGHLTRCLTLASALRKRGVEVAFVSREHYGHLIEKIEEKSFPVYRLQAPIQQRMNNSADYSAWLGITMEQDITETLAVLHEEFYDWLVVDHYGLDAYWEKRARLVAKRILVIDDLSNRNHDCDVLLDQNYFGDLTSLRYQHWVPNRCLCLLGPEFALLQSDYLAMRHLLQPHDGKIQRVLVFFGGSDLSDQTSKVLRVLSYPEFLFLVVDVVIGSNHPNPEGIAEIINMRGNMMLYSNLGSLAGLMMCADLVIGAGGGTTWERMALGMPSLAISIADNQQEFTRILTEEGFQRTLVAGELASVLEWREAINQLMNDPPAVKQLAQKAKILVDALGSQRIVRVMIGVDEDNIQIRKVIPADEKLLFDWANDPDVREQSFNQALISTEQHAAWFAVQLSNPNCVILIGEDDNGLSVGQVRFNIDRDNSEAFIGISLDRTLRGKGVSEKLLRKSLEYFITMEGRMKCVAEVRDENLPSQRLFHRLQFLPVASRRPGSKTFEKVL